MKSTLLFTCLLIPLFTTSQSSHATKASPTNTEDPDEFLPVSLYPVELEQSSHSHAHLRHPNHRAANQKTPVRKPTNLTVVIGVGAQLLHQSRVLLAHLDQSSLPLLPVTSGDQLREDSCDDCPVETPALTALVSAVRLTSGQLRRQLTKLVRVDQHQVALDAVTLRAKVHRVMKTELELALALHRCYRLLQRQRFQSLPPIVKFWI